MITGRFLHGTVRKRKSMFCLKQEVSYLTDIRGDFIIKTLFGARFDRLIYFLRRKMLIWMKSFTGRKKNGP